MSKKNAIVTVDEEPNINEMRKKVYDEIHDDVVDQIKSDLDSQFGAQYRDEIKEKVTNEIIGEIKEKVRKEDARNSRRKSFKIFRLYIYLFVMIGIAVYLIYHLYYGEKVNIYLPNINFQTTAKEEKPVVPTTTTTTKTTTRSQEWYKEQYGHLVNDLKISNLNLLKNGMTVESMTGGEKLSLVLDNMADSDISIEGIIYTINEESLKNKFVELYGENVEYVASNFTNNGLYFAYSETGKNYIAVGEKTNTSKKVFYNMKNISEANKTVVITCYVGIIDGNYIYNVNDLTKPLGEGEYTGNINEYLNGLSIVKFVFKGNDKLHLDSILKA